MHLSQNPRIRHTRRCRRAFTLVEVTAAVVLTALFAAVASQNFLNGGIVAVRNETEVQSLRMELQQLRQEAIATGEVRGIRFNRSGGRIDSVQRFARDASGGLKLLGQTIPLHPDLTEVTANRSSVEFNSEGQSTGATSVQFRTDHRSWQITVVPVTGTFHVKETQQ